MKGSVIVCPVCTPYDGSAITHFICKRILGACKAILFGLDYYERLQFVVEQGNTYCQLLCLTLVEDSWHKPYLL